MSIGTIRFAVVYFLSTLFLGCSIAPKLSEWDSADLESSPRTTLEPPLAIEEFQAERKRGRYGSYRSNSLISENAENVDSNWAIPVIGANRRGTAAPPFTAKTISGKNFDLASQKGKVVVLDFWRQSCGPCLKAMAKVAELRERFPEDRVEIVGINTDERKATPRAYLRGHPHDWEQIHARSQRFDFLGAYRVRYLPHFVVIDQLGNMQYRGGDVATAAAKVAELVEEPSIALLTTSSGKLSPLVSRR